MPIRFDKGDDNKTNNTFTNNENTGSNKGAIAVLLIALFFIWRKPKIAIPVIIILLILAYVFGSSGS